MKKISISIVAAILLLTGYTSISAAQSTNQPKGTVTVDITGELKKWHKITLTFDGPEAAETDKVNPFMNYRFNVVFTHAASGKSIQIPGYFAADGNAGESSATSGNKWRVHIAPDKIGTWTYKVDFRKGPWQAVRERKPAGESAGFMDGAEGSFEVAKSDKTGADNRAKGLLQYDGTRYLKYAETGKPMVKVGPDSPENLLAYADFDGTFHNDGHQDKFVKTWEPHLKDWKEGNPTWKNGKGKAIIGVVNYLVSKGMNVLPFLTMNIRGDDQNVFPFVDYNTYDRYDCSKLDQWEVLFDYADKQGLFLHFKLLEQECQGLLDNGAIGAYTKLYYREIMARFGHHLALNWNIGEESGDQAPNPITPPMNTTQRLAAAEYFYQNDPYKHHIVIHNGPPFDDVIGTNSKYTGASVQVGGNDYSRVHDGALKWINASKNAGKQWAVAIDESGGAEQGLLTDAEDPKHDNARINGLWGGYMAGTWGCEFYFGYNNAQSDLTCQDYRSRDLFWNQCKHFYDFFEGNQIPVTETDNHDNLVQKGDYCLATPGKLYVVLLRTGSGTLNLDNQTGKFSIQWFDPQKGGKLQDGRVKRIAGGSIQKIEGAPSEPNRDWVVLIKKI